jgi:hypothetical protein
MGHWVCLDVLYQVTSFLTMPVSIRRREPVNTAALSHNAGRVRERSIHKPNRCDTRQEAHPSMENRATGEPFLRAAFLAMLTGIVSRKYREAETPSSAFVKTGKGGALGSTWRRDFVKSEACWLSHRVRRL